MAHRILNFKKQSGRGASGNHERSVSRLERAPANLTHQAPSRLQRISGGGALSVTS